MDWMTESEESYKNGYSNGYSDGYKDGLKEGIGLATAKWVKCSERLPSKTDKYFVLRKEYADDFLIKKEHTYKLIKGEGIFSYNPDLIDSKFAGVNPGWFCADEDFAVYIDDKVVYWLDGVPDNADLDIEE